MAIELEDEVIYLTIEPEGINPIPDCRALSNDEVDALIKQAKIRGKEIARQRKAEIALIKDAMAKFASFPVEKRMKKRMEAQRHHTGIFVNGIDIRPYLN